MLLSLLCACDVHPICQFSLTGTLVPVCISALPTLFSMSSSPWFTGESLFHLSRDHFLGWLHWCGCFLSVSMGRGELWVSYCTIFPMRLCCCIINISCNMSELWTTQVIQEPLCKYLSGSSHIEMYAFSQLGDVIHTMDIAECMFISIGHLSGLFTFLCW